MKFKDFLKEDTTSADIATVDTKLGQSKETINKACKKHNILNCKECIKSENKKIIRNKDDSNSNLNMGFHIGSSIGSMTDITI